MQSPGWSVEMLTSALAMSSQMGNETNCEKDWPECKELWKLDENSYVSILRCVTVSRSIILCMNGQETSTAYK